MRAIHLFFLGSACFSFPAYATSIIAVVTPSNVVLGADSKVTPADHSEVWARCKIGVSNDVLWGEARILDVPTKGFSIDSIATTAMAGAGDILTRITAFEKAVVPRLTDILNSLKIGDPEFFQMYEENQSAAEVVFISNERGIPQFHMRYFFAASDPVTGAVSVAVKGRDCPARDCRDGAYVALGLHSAVDFELSNNPTIWKTLGLPMAVRYLIQAQMKANPEAVGPPIAMVEITKQGARWISDGLCIHQ